MGKLIRGAILGATLGIRGIEPKFAELFFCGGDAPHTRFSAKENPKKMFRLFLEDSVLTKWPCLVISLSPDFEFLQALLSEFRGKSEVK